jgi:hypothetical protein
MESGDYYGNYDDEFTEAPPTHQKVNYESLLLLERTVLIALTLYLVLVILIKV